MNYNSIISIPQEGEPKGSPFLDINNIMKWKIYVILNTVNKKRYVGITKNGIESRLKGHSFAKSRLGRDIRRYGKDKFIFTIVTEADNRKDAGLLERKWIDALKTKQAQGGYNCDVILTNNPPIGKNTSLKELESLLFLYNNGLF